MTGKERVYFLLNRIDDKRETTPSGQPILIHPMGDLNGNYPNLELLMLLKKLQDDEKVLKVTRVPITDKEGWSPSYEDDYYGLELLPKFDEYFDIIQHQPEYYEFTNRKPSNQSNQPQQREQVQHNPQRNNSDIVFEINYTTSREILLNNVFQIARPDFDRENDLVFQFLYDNPNKTFTIEEIEGKLGKLTKPLHKIVENLGFNGDLRKVFMSVSKTAICFKNPVTKSDLERLGISRIKLSK